MKKDEKFIVGDVSTSLCSPEELLIALKFNCV